MTGNETRPYDKQMLNKTLRLKRAQATTQHTVPIVQVQLTFPNLRDPWVPATDVRAPLLKIDELARVVVVVVMRKKYFLLQ
jgi:hypothetical protein